MLAVNESSPVSLGYMGYLKRKLSKELLHMYGEIESASISKNVENPSSSFLPVLLPTPPAPIDLATPIVHVEKEAFSSDTKETNHHEQEWIIRENPNRYCLYPIQYPDLFEFYKQHQRMMWTVEEIDFTVDKNDWDTKLTSDERIFLEHILAFFASSDGIVLENLVTNFCREIQLPEARCFYTFQAMMENIHSEVYSLMIDTLVQDYDRKQQLFEAIQHIPCVEQKAQWALQWISPKNSFACRLIAFVIVEGLFFSGSFCAIFWLKERGLLVHSLGKSNEWIARDEGLHQRFGIHLYTRYIENRVEEMTVHMMMRNAVEMEVEFITKSLPVRLIGMNQDLMIQYIQFVADQLLHQLGYTPLYVVTNPFPFMEKIALDGKTNFFEQRVSEYSTNPSQQPLKDDVFDIQSFQEDLADHLFF